MVANTGTYVDSPFHRFPEGIDLVDLLPGMVVRAPEEGRAVGVEAFRGLDL